MSKFAKGRQTIVSKGNDVIKYYFRDLNNVAGQSTGLPGEFHYKELINAIKYSKENYSYGITDSSTETYRRLLSDKKFRIETKSLLKDLRSIGKRRTIMINSDVHQSFGELKQTLAHEQTHARTVTSQLGSWQANHAIRNTSQFKQFSENLERIPEYAGKSKESEEFIAYTRQALVGKEKFQMEGYGLAEPIQSFIKEHNLTRFGHGGTLSFEDLIRGRLKPRGIVPMIKESAPILEAIKPVEQAIKSEIRAASPHGKYALMGIGALGIIGLMGHAFSGKDDNYNTIEGLKHGGFAQKKRREMTPFGSGWDPLRNLVADELGHGPQVFQNFIRSKGFTESLSKGKVLETLGQGAFGEAHLMETSVQIGEKSHTLQYVRKTPLQTKPEKVIAEAKAMHAMSDLNAPNVYGINKENQTYMEHFKGQLAHKVMLHGGTIGEKTIDDLDTFFQAAHKRGIAHLDAIRDVSRFYPGMAYTGEVTPYNVMITPEGRAGVFDWGQATKASTLPRNLGPLSTAEQEKVQFSMTGYIGKKLPTAADLDREMVAGLRRQKGKLSDSYIRKEVTESVSDISGEATNKGHKVPKSTPFPNATFASASESNKLRKLDMAKANKQGSANLFENGRSGGRRSKSTFGSARR